MHRSTQDQAPDPAARSLMVAEACLRVLAALDGLKAQDDRGRCVAQVHDHDANVFTDESPPRGGFIY